MAERRFSTLVIDNPEDTRPPSESIDAWDQARIAFDDGVHSLGMLALAIVGTIIAVNI